MRNKNNLQGLRSIFNRNATTLKNINFFLALVSSSVFILQSLAVVAAPTSQQRTKSFAEWCQQKASVPVSTRHTINVLLQKSGTNSCKLADFKLRSLWSLDLSNQNISDLKPLASLIQLRSLDLNSNRIVNLKSLSSLINLTHLSLNDNQIIDVSPLSGLYSMSELNLDDNKIIDVKPLTGLTRLHSLRLYSNPINTKTCPVKPESTCRF